MIALAALASAAVAAPFSPPLDVAILYEAVQTRPLPDGEVRVTLRQALSFRRDAGGLLAEIVPQDHATDAPEPYRSRIDALFAPGHGVPTQVRIGADGAVGAVVDGARTWAAVRAGVGAALAAIEADPARSPAAVAVARSVAADATREPPAPARDARLADAASALLPPPLPALRPGEGRAFTAALASPAGALPSRGTLRLLTADPASLRYRIETRTDPGAADAAVAGLLAALGDDAPADQRHRLAAVAAGLRGAVFAGRTELEVDRATGLLVRADTERWTEAADGARTMTERHALRRLAPGP